MYSIYFVLLTTLTHFATASTDPKHLVKLRDFIKPYLTCPEPEKYTYRFYTCPSHFWPEIMHKFVPAMEGLNAWMKQKLGGELAVHMAFMLGSNVADYTMKELVQVKEELKAWLLLNRYLKFRSGWEYEKPTYKCLAATLSSLTEMDLTQVSRLPYGGDSDRFDEINELVNDPGKARLLDGLKRATENDFEMSRMLKSLSRWMKRTDRTKGKYDPFKDHIFYAASNDYLKSISVNQLRSETVAVPDFEKDAELRDLVKLLLAHEFSAQSEEGVLPKEFMPEFPGKDYLLDFVTRIRGDTRADEEGEDCRQSIREAMALTREQTNWRGMCQLNKCVMEGLSQVPDSFFEEYQALSKEERWKFQNMLGKASLPRFYNTYRSE